MTDLFNVDGPVLQFVNKIVYSVYLNILWFLCCIPVITVGASTTALFYVTLKISKNEEGNITKAFFRSFRQNFRQGTLIWLILLAAGIILGVDGYVLYHMRFENLFWTLCTAVFCLRHRPDVYLSAPCKIRQYHRRHVQKRAVHRRPFSVLYRTDGCRLFYHAAGHRPHLYPGRHLRRRPLRPALFLPAVQYSAALSGEERTARRRRFRDAAGLKRQKIPDLCP